MSKWQSLDELIARMPGGRFIGDQWRTEHADKGYTPVNFININEDWDVTPESRDEYTFAQNLIIAAVAEFGPLLPDPDEDYEGTLNVPDLIAEMFAFWADEWTWSVD